MEPTVNGQQWRRVRLYFDGSARGNPGPGGSGWALTTFSTTSSEWDLKACGYKYQGPAVTNNHCEYEALREGLALAWRVLRNTDTHLEVYGDSNMIIQQQQGRAVTRAPYLQLSANRVTEVHTNFSWITWSHVKRDFNKTADYMANAAMDSQGAATITEDSTNIGKQRFLHARILLEGDLQGDPSASGKKHTIASAISGTS